MVVCTFNRADMLCACLSSLVGQGLSPARYEIIVVNNNCTDYTSNVVSRFCADYPHVRMVSEPLQGLSAARNRGWQEARGTYVVYIDDDAWAPQFWLERILAAFTTARPQPVIVTGMVKPYYRSARVSWFLDEYEVMGAGGSTRFLSQTEAVDSVRGTNMAFTRTILQETRGFSESFGMRGKSIGVGEETALCRQIYEKQPYFWFDPDIEVLHSVYNYTMSIRYRAYRAFLSGMIATRIKRLCGSWAYILKLVAAALFHGCISLLCIPWGRRHWQRSALYRICAVAYLTGKIRELTRQKIGRYYRPMKVADA